MDDVVATTSIKTVAGDDVLIGRLGHPPDGRIVVINKSQRIENAHNPGRARTCLRW